MILRDLLTVLAGLVVGVASGVIGIGGGILLVPIMVLGFGYGQHLAQGTSLFAVIPTSLAGALTHARYGNVVWRAGLWMGLGGALGALLGAAFALGLPREVLARAFGLLLIVSAWQLWPRPARPEPEKGAPPAP